MIPDPHVTQKLAYLDSLIRQIRDYDRKYDGDPNGNVDAPRGATCRDKASGDVYRKTTASGDTTGWVTP